MAVIFTLNDASRPFTKSVWRERRLFEIVTVECRDRDDSENVETLLGRICIPVVAEFVMVLFCKICDTVQAGVSEHFL